MTNRRFDIFRKVCFFFGAAFLAAGFLAAGFLAAGFLALVAFFAAGFLATFFALGFLVTGFFFSALTTAGSLKQPAPFLPAAPPATTFLAADIFLRASFTRTWAFAASTLLLATMYLRMACRDEPFLSLRALMAVAIMVAYGG